MSYTKLFSSLVHSTIWRAPDHVRLVWITMLAISDRDGIVEASIPGLADAARVTLEECEAALEHLQSPDKYSRSKVAEGRRIREAPGGWELINHGHYREMMSAEDQREKAAKRQQRKRDRDRGKPPTRVVTPRHAATVTTRDVSRRVTDVTTSNQIRSDQPATADPRTDQVTARDTHHPTSAAAVAANPEPRARPPNGPSPPSRVSGPLDLPPPDPDGEPGPEFRPVNFRDAMRLGPKRRAEYLLANDLLSIELIPQQWPEVVNVAKALHEASKLPPPKLGAYAFDGDVKRLVELLAVFELDELLAVARHLPRSEWWAKQRETRGPPGIDWLTVRVVRKALATVQKPSGQNPAVQRMIDEGRADIERRRRERETRETST